MDESRGPWAPALRGPFLTKVHSIRSPPGLRCLHPRVRIGWVKNTLGPRRPASATSGEMPALGREAAGPALRRDVQRLESAAAPPRQGGFLGGRQQKPRGRDWGSSEKDAGAVGRCEGWTRGPWASLTAPPAACQSVGSGMPAPDSSAVPRSTPLRIQKFPREAVGASGAHGLCPGHGGTEPFAGQSGRIAHRGGGAVTVGRNSPNPHTSPSSPIRSLLEQGQDASDFRAKKPCSA